MSGCALARLGTGIKPERQAATSSKAVGGWWNDPIFSADAKLKEVVLQPGEKGPLPACMQKRDMMSTSAEVGGYWLGTGWDDLGTSEGQLELLEVDL